MKTERIMLSNLLVPGGDKLFNQIAAEIQQGAVFIYPTETIYGVGGNTELPDVEEKIYNVKRRPTENPMIHLAAKPQAFSSLLVDLPPAAECLVNAFWPGLLTLVVPTINSSKLIAIRVSDHPFLRSLFDYISFPVYSTSANISGEPYNPDPDHIYNTFHSEIDFMIDGGLLPPSLPSTVIKIDHTNNSTIIREGVVKKTGIDSVLEKAGFSLTL